MTKNQQTVLLIERRLQSCGGAQHYLKSVVEVLARAGFDVCVAVNDHPNLGEYYARIRQAGGDVHLMPLNDSLPPDETGRWLRQLVERLEPNVVHVNGSSRALDAAVTAMTKRGSLPCPLTFTIHGPLFPPRLYWSRSLKSRLPFSYRHRTLRSTRRYVRLFDRFISVSSHNGELAAESLNVLPEMITYIPNAVDIDHYRPDGSQHRRNDDSGSVMIGTCGSLVPVKRHDVLIYAMAKLAEHHRVRLRLAGDGSEKARLLRLVAELGLDQQVEFCGHLDDVLPFLQSLDVFVMTSDSEGLPYAQLEAMAAGLPSAVTAVGDLPELVQHNVNGLLSQPGNVKECATNLHSLIEDPILRQRMGEAAREHVAQLYSHEQFARRTREFFLENANTAQQLNGRKVQEYVSFS